VQIISNGVLTKSPTIVQTFTPATWNGWTSTSGFYWDAYSAIYKRHLWVAVLVNKIANANARLPLKVYERDDLNRPEAATHPYAVLLARPSKTIDPFLFWLWTISTLNIFGESFWAKVRDAGGRPIELIPIHPTRVHDDDGDWQIDVKGQRIGIKRRDLVQFRTFNPDSLTRGLSPLEPLRSTLENEDGALRANSAMWRNGAVPRVLLQHPKNLSPGASGRIKQQWDDIHTGADNWAKTAVLEEGMTASVLPLNVLDLQYVEGRKLNITEACAAYDVPPPVVHILDHATFSNITEQMRSMYRDTMAPKLKLVESTLELELRDGTMGESVEPDFGANVYAEFLLDEVLRGDFEARAAAYQAADYMTQAEKRRAENLPFIEGTDRILVNAAQVPLKPDADDDFDPHLVDRANTYGTLIRAGTTPDSAAATAGLDGLAHTGLPPVTLQSDPLDANTIRTLNGRLARTKSLADIDLDALTAGLNGEAPLVRSVVLEATAEGITVPELRQRLKALGGSPT
jgi:HK97 family phage portal protein